MFRSRTSAEVRTDPAFCTPYNFGVNAIFLPLIPYTLVTALHDTHLELALILSTAFTGGIILFGIVLRFAGGYRTWPYVFELHMLVVNAVLLGVSYPKPDEITKYHNFISNAFYATFSIVSIMVTMPFTFQYVREFVPPAAASHDKVISAAYATTSVWTAVFVTNTLIYLIPVCRGRDDNHMNALNLLFRIILPILFAFFAALVTRVWPTRVLQHLIGSAGFDGAMRKVVVNPLAFSMGPPGFPPPPLHPSYGPAGYGHRPMAGPTYMPPAPIQVQAVAS